MSVRQPWRSWRPVEDGEAVGSIALARKELSVFWELRED